MTNSSVRNYWQQENCNSLARKRFLFYVSDGISWISASFFSPSFKFQQEIFLFYLFFIWSQPYLETNYTLIHCLFM